jgi:hypothetical protein
VQRKFENKIHGMERWCFDEDPIWIARRAEPLDENGDLPEVTTLSRGMFIRIFSRGGS